VPEGIVYGWFDGILYLLDTGRREVYRLDGLAADCWRALAGYGSTDTALTYLREQHGTFASAALVQRLASDRAAFLNNDLLQAARPAGSQE
jgi:hypothetical protein